MSDEKHHYVVEESAPIPTYEEATSSHAHARLGPQEASDDAERQGLLGAELTHLTHLQTSSRRRTGFYHPPSVQSVDDSDGEGGDGDGDDGGPDPRPARHSESEDVALRQEMEQMDLLDPEAADEGSARRRRLRLRFSKRFSQMTDRLSGFHLPRIPWPSMGFGWLTRRLPTIQDEYRPGWAILARLCGLVAIISLVYLLVVSEIIPIGRAGFGPMLSPEGLRQQAQESVDPWRIQENLKYITSFGHVGGSEGSFFIGQWIEGKFKEAHMDSFEHDDYFVYMNYPAQGGRRVAIVDPPEKAWEAKLEEASAYDPPRAQTAAFHGLAASGNVTGPLMYVNYGHPNDFKRLSEKGLHVKGAVVLMRYYGTQSDPAMKVRAAQAEGAAGVLIYSDPAEDGFKKGEVWPMGPWRPEDSVQRGSVGLANWILGDVLTPGVPSTKDAKRISKDKNPALPAIPSLPLSWKDAQKLLQSLKGIGEELSGDWVGAVPDVGKEWFSGHPDKSPRVNLQNIQDEVEKQPIQNVFGSFIGTEEKAKKIIVGNHRDSWCFGAADPGSGTAVMLEVARVLGELRMTGWRPLRTIEFASFDAAEYNLIGSTEHVEANMDDLRADAVAYLNVDVGVTGNKLWANGSPVFQNAWMRAIARVQDPRDNITLKDLWTSDNSKLGALGGGSDFVAFQDMAGCSSIDFGFAGPQHGDMYHSCYETFEWVTKYVDPGFKYHNLLAQLWVLLILELAQEPILPFRLNDYAVVLQTEVQNLIVHADTKVKNKGRLDKKIFQPLKDAVGRFAEISALFHHWEDFWYDQVYGTGGFESPGLTMQRLAHNSKMSDFETRLLDLPKGEDKGGHGIPGREQYKHVIYGPDASGSGSGYDAAIFPFVRDAIDKEDWKLVERQLEKTAKIIRGAVDGLAS